MIAKMLAAGLMLFATAAAAPRYEPTGPIERKYAADGPWATSVMVSDTACDREGNVCDICPTGGFFADSGPVAW